jgi:hypothetical protein
VEGNLLDSRRPSASLIVHNQSKCGQAAGRRCPEFKWTFPRQPPGVNFLHATITLVAGFDHADLPLSLREMREED